MKNFNKIYSESTGKTEFKKIGNDIEKLRTKFNPVQDEAILLSIFRDISIGIARGMNLKKFTDELLEEFNK